MTLRPDPHTEIREALERERVFHARALLRGQGVSGLAYAKRAVDAALARLEREAAERETALAEAREHADGMARAPYGEFEAMRQRAEAAEARVREVEAERDKAVEKFDLLAAAGDNWPDLARLCERYEKAEATVARQAETLREIAEWPFNSTTGGGLGEPARLARAVLASPEAPAAEPPPKIADELVEALWDFDKELVLSLLRPGRIAEWKARFFDLRVRLTGEVHAAAALPAVDAPPEPRDE